MGNEWVIGGRRIFRYMRPSRARFLRSWDSFTQVSSINFGFYKNDDKIRLREIVRYHLQIKSLSTPKSDQLLFLIFPIFFKKWFFKHFSSFSTKFATLQLGKQWLHNIMSGLFFCKIYNFKFLKNIDHIYICIYISD